MMIQNPMYGKMDIEASKVITFPQGLVGMPEHKHWALLAPIDKSYFYWLQSVDHPEVMFVVTEPSRFVKNYRVDLPKEVAEVAEIMDVEDGVVMVIVNQESPFLTGNLQGPLVINARKLVGVQMILPREQYSTRHVLLELHQGPQSMAA